MPSDLRLSPELVERLIRLWEGDDGVLRSLHRSSDAVFVFEDVLTEGENGGEALLIIQTGAGLVLEVASGEPHVAGFFQGDFSPEGLSSRDVSVAEPQFRDVMAVEGRFVPAAWLIFFATIFDGLDGKVARSLGGGTQFGLEFDSLADLVSFGIAPGMLFYLVSFRGVLGILGAVVLCFFVLCVALRLARFNVVHIPGPFQGLLSPAGGLSTQIGRASCRERV